MKPTNPIQSLSVLLALFCLASGCAHSSQLTKLQNEKSQLTAIVAQEKNRNEKLEEQLVAMHQRTADAERELALLHDGPQALSPGSLASLGKSSRLASFEPWAKSQAELRFDPVRRVARMPLDISFTSDDRLPFNARRELDKAADLLLAPEARHWGARVIHQDSEIGETRVITRSNAVLDYLQQRGVAHDRLEVSPRKALALVDEDGRRTKASSSRVELEFFETTITPVTNSNTSNIATESKADGWTPAKDRRR